MSTLVYMKILELTPARYDSWMRFLTLGRVDRLKSEIAGQWINSGDKILEIGCGTGSLAALMTKRGAKVTGIDISEKMLAEARKNVPTANFHHLTALEIDQFKGQEFNRIVATLSFSELSADELDEVLRLAKDILKPGGLLIVADEVKTEKPWQQLLAALIRWPIALITFLLTQQTTHVIKDFVAKISTNQFKLIHRRNFLLGTMALFISKREKETNVKLT